MRYSLGFSLAELLVVIAIAGVLAALAVPGFQGLIASSNLTSTTNDLITTLTRAKSDAIRRGKRVTVCKSADGASCISSGDWTQGWIMFNDNNHADPVAVENTADIREITPAPSGGVLVKSNQGYFSFSADGQAKLMNGGNGAGTIRICNPSAALTNDTRARNIVISWAGRLKVEKLTGIAQSCPAP